MHHPQHHFHHQHQNDDERGGNGNGNGNGGGGGGVNGNNTSIARPAVATRSSSRQTFYKNRIPTSHGSLHQQHQQHQQQQQQQQQQQYNHPQQSDVGVGNNNGGIGIGQPSSSTLDHSYNSRHTNNMTTNTNMRNNSSAVNVATATARAIAANTTTTTTMVSSSSDELSTDSSLDELHMPYSNTPMGGGEGRGTGNNTGSGLTGGLGGGGIHEHQPHHAHQRQGGLPPPKQLHADYSHRLHKNQVAQGHHNFVVGGAHGRYRDYGGTLIEVPEEVYAVRKAALTVLDPITYCWVSLC